MIKNPPYRSKASIASSNVVQTTFTDHRRRPSYKRLIVDRAVVNHGRHKGGDVNSLRSWRWTTPAGIEVISIATEADIYSGRASSFSVAELAVLTAKQGLVDDTTTFDS